MTRAAFPSIAALVGFTLTAVVAQAFEKLPLSVCELIARRSDYNGQLVTVRGEVKGSTHGAALFASSDCQYRLVTKEVTWPNVVFLAFPNKRSPRTEDHADFQVDWKSVQKAEDTVKRSGFNHETDQIIQTYVGRFVTYTDLENRVNPVRLGGSKLGFGPVGLDAPAQLLIKSVTDVLVRRGTRDPAKPSIPK